MASEIRMYVGQCFYHVKVVVLLCPKPLHPIHVTRGVNLGMVRSHT